MAAADDELAYLQPGFALSSLTVPKLRSVLVSHDIPYPSAAKKLQLIQLVEEQVLPQSRGILNARARTKRTSKGITDMPSSQESNAAGEEDQDEDGMGEDENRETKQMAPPPPPVPAKTPRGRRSKHNLTADDMITNKELPPTPHAATATRRSRTPTTAKKSTTKHPRHSDSEKGEDDDAAAGVRPSARKTRKSSESRATTTRTTPPRVQIDEPDAMLRAENRAQKDTPFSTDNPFQSGSSPPTESRRVSSQSVSRSRKSLGVSREERRRASAGRQKSSSPHVRPTKREDGDVVPPSRQVFDFASSTTSNAGQREDVQPTEEFTPEEQLELVRERASQGYSGKDLLPSRPSTLTRRRRKSNSTTTKSITWAVLISLLGSIAAWYRKEKVDIGYCGVGQPEWSLSNFNTNIPSWVQDSLQPACEPCPQHGFCYPAMQVKCENDFVLKPHPLSLGGLIPLPPTCEADGEKVRRVKAVADRAVEELRERRAAYECGEDVSSREEKLGKSADPTDDDDDDDDDDDVRPSSASGTESQLPMSDEALKQRVGKMRRKDMSDAEFDDLWQGALGEITGQEEVEVSRDGTGRLFLSSSSLARLPFGCAIRRSLLRTLSRNRLPLAALGAVLLMAAYVRRKVTFHQRATAQIPGLVTTTLDRLATQAVLAAEGRMKEGFLSEGQLRDDVLRSILGKDERQRLWRGVKAVVEQNSNVRAGEREDERTGEWSRVWEWIGPLDVVVSSSSSSSSPSRPPAAAAAGDQIHRESSSRSRSRIRLSGIVGKNVGVNKEAAHHQERRWDEGRPMY